MRDHKSLLAWQEAQSLSLQALRISKSFWAAHAAELFRQFQRASLSIQLNIAEGHALGDRGRFANHLAVAYGSAVETADLLDLLREAGVIPSTEAERASQSAHRCERLLLGLLKRYRKKPER
jgi:four helix bundle protein